MRPSLLAPALLAAGCRSGFGGGRRRCAFGGRAFDRRTLDGDYVHEGCRPAAVSEAAATKTCEGTA